jgi:hypothetical protein
MRMSIVDRFRVDKSFIIKLLLQKSLTHIALLSMGVVSTYGLAFFCATAALAFLSTNHWLEGAVWTEFLLAIVALVMFFLSLLVKEFKGDRS